ncbi:MAG: hypothetical protein J7521_06290 [Caulobacter sp.]|nr:hypothetical protein [Caulobacter sp.]
MRNPFGLLLPALIPSWNFFDVIAPSPRVEYAVSDSPAGEPDWRAFGPRPERVSPLAMLGRLFWNPRWNQTLFVVSCAERLADQFTDHSQDEIFRRIGADLGPEMSGRWLRFRLIFVRREGEAIVAEELYVSDARRIGDPR